MIKFKNIFRFLYYWFFKNTYIGLSVKIGKNTKIYRFVQIYGDTYIGNDCLISSFVSIQGDVVIGNNVRLGDFSFIPSATIVCDNVFIGSNVSISNDRMPRAGNKNWICEGVVVDSGAAIGSGSVILPGLVIAANTLIGGGSVLTKDTRENEVWAGNPARQLVQK